MDTEAQRIEYLLHRVRIGEATEAELEELQIYAAERPTLRETVSHALATRDLGNGWLARVDADNKLQRAERAVWPERAAALAMTIFGYFLIAASPAIGLGLFGFGTALLIVSMVRVRVSHRDPYTQVDQ